VGKPVKFISTGEKIEDLDAFYPDRMASRILGMGDVISLVEKAQQSISEKDAEDVAMRMMKGEFNLQMFMDMQKMMKKMGPMGNVMKMMGMGSMLGISSDQADEVGKHGDQMMKLYETVINSMTKEEKEHPEIINMSRRRRIARGSGMKDSEIGQMLNQFEEMKKVFDAMFGMFKGGGFPGAGGGGGFPFGGGGLGGGGFPFGGGRPPFGGGGANGGSGPKAGLPPGIPPAGGFRPGKGPKGFPPLGGPGGGYYRKKKKKH
jgi:signal recognition particle subunit SRP54